MFSLYPSAVEQYYSNGVYPWIAFVQRILFGWVPFSVGDLFYAAAVIWLIRELVKFIRAVKKKRLNRQYLKLALLKTLTIALAVYCAFNILWGLNYNRYGIDYQMNIESADYDDKDLETITSALALRMNELQPSSLNTRRRLHRKRNLFKGADSSYLELQKQNAVFTYRFPSIKPSLYSYAGNYLGFTGYYNPFTGEAQVNTAVPVFIQPFVACHEIGHQLGYAKESEANFAAYLSGSSSGDTAFLYSVYFELFAYASRYLYYTDSVALRRIQAQLSPAVKEDVLELRTFLRKYDTPIETAIDRLYSQFLKANEQPSGRMSYNEVVGMLIAYYKKTGKI